MVADLRQWVWVDGTLLINYTTEERRSIACSALKKTYFEKNPNKWLNLLTPYSKFKFNDVWKKKCPRKDVDFLLTLFHKAIAMNAWKTRPTRM
jgi:hypothetical protein